MNCLCIVPGFCKMIFSKNSAGPVGKALIVMIDFLALVAQATAFFVIMGTQYTAFIEKALHVTTPAYNEPKPVDINFNGDPFAESQRQMGGDLPNGGASDFAVREKPTWKGSWEAPFALLFTSISWWENYVDRDIKLGFINMPLATYKRHLQSVRSKANIGASLWKIALTITFSVILLPSKKFDNAFVKIPTYPDATTVPTLPAMSNNGESMVDFGGFDTNMERKKRDILETSTIALGSVAMNLEQMLTVPNNAWNNPTTPNLFDFTAIKVSRLKTNRQRKSLVNFFNLKF